MDRNTETAALSAAVADTDLLGNRRGVEVRLLRQPDGLILEELGRLRAAAFAAVGEGSGEAVDLDAYDTHYHHLFLWRPDAERIIGAYRLADCAEVLSRHGVEGLYSASLFELSPALLARLQTAVELGRSFIVPEHWGEGWLALLWAGIGAWLRQHPHIDQLFGPVSISPNYPDAARDLLVHFCRHHFPATRELVAAPRTPFEPAPLPARSRTLLEQPYPHALKALRRLLRELGCDMPTLYRQYTGMGGPDACQFLGFGVDAQFGGCVDGLILSNLSLFDKKRLKKYYIFLERSHDR